MKTVKVPLSQNPYDILIGTDIFDRFGEYFASWTGNATHAAIISDTNVEPLYALRIAEVLEESGVASDLCVVEAGEESKCTDMAAALWERLIECGTSRKSVVVAVGGGVVGDLAGFVAATLNRGLKFVQVPTTLLAQVDSSVGGKTGINIPQGKNLVGAFWQPVGVFMDTRTLHTLDDRQYRAGLAEVVKYGVIMDSDFFAFLENSVDKIQNRDPATLTTLISRCCELKAEVVLEDERETTGRRAILNYGHTMAHAVEKLCGFGTFLHGEAVGIGMDFAARLALRFSPEDAALRELYARQKSLLEALSIPAQLPQVSHFPHFTPDAILETMAHDKKASEGFVQFVLPSRIGACEVRTIQISDIL